MQDISVYLMINSYSVEWQAVHKLERIWKESAMCLFEVLFGFIFGQTEQDHEKLLE